MRRKLRDLERDLKSAGFSKVSRRGKGSHELWFHPQTGKKVLVPQPKGDLLPDYVDKQVRKAILESREE
jgi:predicted RNA binding protein YcfA (HicA-like mRNA interferase family)